MSADESNSQPPLGSDEDLSLRIKKAMRRAELLTYAAVGLGVALLALIIIISLL